jgi:hypothetical protein
VKKSTKSVTKKQRVILTPTVDGGACDLPQNGEV